MQKLLRSMTPAPLATLPLATVPLPPVPPAPCAPGRMQTMDLADQRAHDLTATQCLAALVPLPADSLGLTARQYLDCYEICERLSFPS